MLLIEQSIERGKGNIIRTRKMLYARKMLKRTIVLTTSYLENGLVLNLTIC